MTGICLRSLVAVAALLCAALPAWADLDVRDRVGFGGRWIIGAPTPYTLSLANSGPEPVVALIRVSTGASYGMHDIEHARVVRVDAGAIRDEVFLLDGPQAWRGAIRVTIEVEPTVPIRCGNDMADRGSMSFERPSGDYGEATGIEFPTHVIGMVGDPRAAVAAAIVKNRLSPRDENRPTAATAMAAVDVHDGLLRLAPLALEGIEALVVCDPDARTCAEPAALEGVIDWVALGGTLVVSLGEHAAEFASSPLAAQLPARWTGAQRRPMGEILTELGVAADTETPAPWTELRVASEGATILGEGPRGPRGIERRIGMGRVVVLAYDVRAALSRAADGAAIGGKAFGRVLSLDVPPEVRNDQQHWEGSSFAGLTSTFASALQRGAFAPPPLPLVILGIVVYVVVVGPLDWFVLKRLRKERLTTLTFLGAVLAFTTLAFGASVLLFSSGARVNRIVITDLADAGGGGRQVIRTIDVAGFYSPRGSDQPLSYASPAVLLDGSFPGLGFGGDVGSSLPVTVGPGDPLHPDAIVQLPFRSQRVVRAHSVGTLGPTIEVDFDDKGVRPRVRVTNGLGVDLDEVLVYTDSKHAFVLGAIASGAKSKDGEFWDVCELRQRPPMYGDQWGGPVFWGRDTDVSREEMRRLLEAMTLGSFTREAANPPNSSPDTSQNADESGVLHRLGLSRDDAFARGRLLVVAFASQAPVPLPGAAVEGDTHVVIRKEVPKR